MNVQERIANLKDLRERLLQGEELTSEMEQYLWDTVILCKNVPFRTAKNVMFFYLVQNDDLIISKNSKVISKSSVIQSFKKAIELQREFGVIGGPKKLGTFGASYIYPILVWLGIIKEV